MQFVIISICISLICFLISFYCFIKIIDTYICISRILGDELEILKYSVNECDRRIKCNFDKIEFELFNERSRKEIRRIIFGR